jgi:hypothetical protein
LKSYWLFSGSVLFIVVFQGYAMFCCESKEVVAMYPVLSARKTEGNQIALLNPSQDGYFAHAAVPGYCSRGEVLGVVVLYFRIHMMPP